MEPGLIIFFVSMSVIALSLLAATIFFFNHKTEDAESKADSMHSGVFTGLIFLGVLAAIANQGMNLVN